MRVLLCIVAAACVLATEVAVKDKEMSEEQLATHYKAIGDIASDKATMLSSARLSEIAARSSVKDPMKTIHDTIVVMIKDINVERGKAHRAWIKEKKYCSTTNANYDGIVKAKISCMEKHAQLAAKAEKTWPPCHSKLRGMLDSIKANNKTCHAKWDDIVDKKAKHDKLHAEFLALKAAFEKAIGEIGVIRRVLMGEGSLSDLHATGFLEESPISERLNRIGAAVEHPHVHSLLQSFSTAFSKLEGSQSANGDMDAVNALLDKVKDNLVKALKLATDQEDARTQLYLQDLKQMVTQWADCWTRSFNMYKEHGECLRTIGKGKMGQWDNTKEELKCQKVKQATDILQRFLHKRCRASRRAYVRAMRSFANEKNALQQVKKYLVNTVFPGWSKRMTDVASTPYKFKPEKPVYVTVKNTFSSIYGGYDEVSCRTTYNTKYTKLRILTAADANAAKYIDPNDYAGTENFRDPTMREKLEKRKMNCQLFPEAIPVGRAASCLKTTVAKARVDLRGTGYKFTKEGVKAWKALGHGVTTSKVRLSNGDQVLDIEAAGRCADLYYDDAPRATADYRSDPIPIEKK
jgi:hypothetical protein